MRLGITKLDNVLGDVREGDVLLIETVGSLGVEIVSKVVKDGGIRTIVLLPRGASERRIFETENVELLIIGEDVHVERLHELLHLVRELPPGSLLISIRFDMLFLFHAPETVYMFMEDLISTVQEKNLVFIATIDKRNVSERDMAVFENISTHIIDIVEVVRGSQVTSLLRVKKSPKGGTQFWEFKVQNGEVIIEDSSYDI